MAFDTNVPLATNQIAADLTAINANWEFIDPSITTIWIPAVAMIPTVTNGAQAGTNEYATNDIMQGYFAFIKATEHYVAFSLVMPDSWNLGTIKAKFYWAPGDAACTAGDTVEWELTGVGLANDDAIDTATGGSQVITDTVLTGKNGDLHITSATPAMTISGSPAIGELINFKVSRNVGGTDDMTEDAWLFGVRLQLTTNVSITATAW